MPNRPNRPEDLFRAEKERALSVRNSQHARLLAEAKAAFDKLMAEGQAARKSGRPRKHPLPPLKTSSARPLLKPVAPPATPAPIAKLPVPVIAKPAMPVQVAKPAPAALPKPVKVVKPVKVAKAAKAKKTAKPAKKPKPKAKRSTKR